MFTKSPIDTELDERILSALSKLKALEPNSEEYGKIVENLTELHKLKTEKSKPISPDTMLMVAANIFGILWITRYEKTDTITTKSLGFSMKPR